MQFVVRRVANFTGVKFNRGAKFSHTEFSRAVDFSGARFLGEADFRKAIFKGKADFTRAIFFGKAYFGENESHFRGDAIFKHVLFEGGEKINFDLKDLSNVSFTDTDITRVRFDENVQ